MASIDKLPSGGWRVQIRRRGQTLSRTFRLKLHADKCARNQENRIDKGESANRQASTSRETFGDLIDLHFADLNVNCIHFQYPY